MLQVTEELRDLHLWRLRVGCFVIDLKQSHTMYTGQSFVNLSQAQIIGEEGASIKKMPPKYHL